MKKYHGFVELDAVFLPGNLPYPDVLSSNYNKASLFEGRFFWGG